MSTPAPPNAREASDVSGGRLVRNTIANGAGGVVVAAIALAMTPFLLGRLGAERYGLWVLALSTTVAYGYGKIGDLGLQQAVTREIAAARARGDDDAISRMVCTALALVLISAAVLASLVLLAVPRLLDVFDVSADLRAEAAIVLAVLSIQLLFDLPTLILASVTEGAQHYGWFRIIEVGSRAAWAVAAVPVVLSGGGLVALAVVSLAVSVVWTLVALSGARAAQADLRFGRDLVDPAVALWLMPRAFDFMKLQVLSIVYRNMDRIILGVMVGTVVVAQYEIVYKIHATAAMVLAIAPSAVLPAASYLDANDDPGRLRRMYLEGTAHAVAMVTPITLAAIIFTRPLLEVWVGGEFTDLTGTARLFLSFPIMVSLHAVGLTMIVGLGHLKTVVRLNVASIALNLTLSVWLAPRLGLIGVVWGTVAGYALLWIPYLVIMLRTFRVSLREFVGSTIVPNVPGAVVQVGLGLALLGLVSSSPSLLTVGAGGALTVGVSLAAYLFVGLRPEARQKLLATIRPTRAADA